MRGALIIFVTLTVCAGTALGQTASDIERTYGSPAVAYPVSEHIWMTPEYAADGQICRARLYPKRISANTNYFYAKRPSDELEGVLNQLVPPNSRGRKRYGDFAMSEFGGVIVRTTYPFEKVTFTFLLSFTIKELPKSEEFPALLDGKHLSSEKKAANIVKPGDEFPNASAPDPEIVEIWWKDRKCVGR
jgi:hypothetical protein